MSHLHFYLRKYYKTLVKLVKGQVQRTMDKVLSGGKKGLKNFAEFSTVHGFRELYYAQSFLWKIVWLIVFSSASIISIWQGYRIIVTVCSQPTVSVIQPLSDDISYPPLKVCYHTWAGLVNWTSAKQLGFNRNSLQYGLSVFSDVVSEAEFNTTEARLNFEKTMDINNFTDSIQFLEVVTYDSPPGIDIKIPFFTEWKLTVELLSETYPCYSLAHEAIRKCELS